MNWDGLGHTKLDGGRSVHKTQEGVEKKMRGQKGGEPKQMVKSQRELVRVVVRVVVGVGVVVAVILPTHAS